MSEAKQRGRSADRHAGFGTTAAGEAAAVEAGVLRETSADHAARQTLHTNDGEGVHVVLGAAGGTGAAVARELARRGVPARAVARRAPEEALPGVERVVADVTDPAQLRGALTGATVVYHCVQPPYTRWAQDFPAMTRAIVEATAAAGAKLVFADNLYMYGPQDGPLSERSPVTASTRKGSVRAEMAAELLAAHREGRVRVVIARSSDYYGPGGLNSAFGERQLRALVAGKKVQWFADLDQPHTMNYLEDMACAMVVLGRDACADGEVWHLPAAEPLTGRQFIESAARVVGTSATPAVLGLGSVRFAGLFVPVLREFPELWYQWDRPFVSDASKFTRAFRSFAVTSHDEALGQTIGWYREHARTAF